MTIPPSLFQGDDGTLTYATAAGIAIPGIEANVREGRETFSLADSGPRRRRAVFLSFGQSNGANTGQGFYRPRHPVYAFNPLDMTCYRAEDPLPGASGDGASAWGRLGDRLIEAGKYDQIIFVPIAVGGTYLAEWAPEGPLFRRLVFAIERTARAGLTFDALFWHQGEAEANLTDMSPQHYQQLFLTMVQAIRNRGVSAPLYVAQTSYCATADHPFKNRDNIRAAQRAVVNLRQQIFAGPDTDRIGDEGRFDRCHFSETGLEQCAGLWYEALIATPPSRRWYRPSWWFPFGLPRVWRLPATHT